MLGKGCQDLLSAAVGAGWEYREAENVFKTSDGLLSLRSVLRQPRDYDAGFQSILCWIGFSIACFSISHGILKHTLLSISCEEDAMERAAN